MGAQICPIKANAVIFASTLLKILISNAGLEANEEGKEEMVEHLYEGSLCAKKECAWYVKKRKDQEGWGNCCSMKLLGVMSMIQNRGGPK